MSSAAPTSPRFAALLLAGGRSRRMGEDKALLPWRGRPLWLAQAEKLAALAPARLIVACREEQGLHNTPGLKTDVEWLFDPPGEDLGPIAAIARALDGLPMPLLVLAVDMPWMPAELLRDQLLGEERGLFYRGSHGYEPLAGVYVPRMRDAMLAAIRKGDLGLQSVVEAAVSSGNAVVRPMPVTAEPFFQNANTQMEWKSATAAPPAPMPGLKPGGGD